jgi:hypothetical protein
MQCQRAKKPNGTNGALNLEKTADDASDNLIHLQGGNKAIADRLAQEDVLTIPQLAHSDPVRLAMRTNLSFNFIADSMSQVLAWIYLENDLDKLRPLGMRGAVEIKWLMWEFDGARNQPHDEHAQQRAVTTCPLLAQAIGQSEAAPQILFRWINCDPYTTFLADIWIDPLATGC